MAQTRLSGWLATVGVSFALGFGVAWFARAPAPQAADAAAAAPVPAPGTPAPLNPFSAVHSSAESAGGSARLPSNASGDELWAQALLPPDRQQAGFEAEDRLRKLVQANPVELRKLLQRFESDRTPQARELLKSILSTVPTPEVSAFAMRLAGSSNAAERKYGFELVDSLAPDSAEVRGLIRRSLASEQSPDVLAQALQALKPGTAEPEETDQVLVQLRTLAQHSDDTVRRQAISQLAQWDKKGESSGALTQALSDRSPEVRQAAIFAIAQSGVRSDAIKTALLAIAVNAQESRDVRGSAIQALERFQMSKEEHASLARARAQLPGL